MPAATKIGDGTAGVCDVGLDCCPHSRAGNNAAGSPNVIINGAAAHRLNDTGLCNCPHGGTFGSTSGSGSVFVNGRSLTRFGDTTTCLGCGQTGSHVSGSSNVFVDDKRG